MTSKVIEGHFLFCEKVLWFFTDFENERQNIDDIGFIYKDNQENEYGLPELKLDNNSILKLKILLKKIGIDLKFFLLCR